MPESHHHTQVQLRGAAPDAALQKLGKVLAPLQYLLLCLPNHHPPQPQHPPACTFLALPAPPKAASGVQPPTSALTVCALPACVLSGGAGGAKQSSSSGAQSRKTNLLSSIVSTLK